MKKKISLIAIVIAIILISFTTFSNATEVEPRTAAGEAVTTALEDEAVTTELGDEQNNQETEYIWVEKDLFMMSDKDYTMDQLINGNVYLLVNGDVKISGTVQGSVFVIANGTIEFTEECYIDDTIYALTSDDIKISAEVYDVYSVSDKLEITEEAYIWRDVKSIAKEMKLRGVVYRDAHLSADNINVKDETSELLIGGDFNYSSPTAIEGIEDVVVYGDVNFTMQDDTEEIEETTVAETIKSYIGKALKNIVYVLIIFGLLSLLAPNYGEKVGKDLKEKGIVAFSIGLLFWIIMALVIIISIILLFTSVGVPVAIITWLLILIGIYISPAIFSIAILNIVKPKVKANTGVQVAILAGIVATGVWVLQQLPYIGSLISFVVLTIGLGLVLRNTITKKGKTEEIVAEVNIENNENNENNNNNDDNTSEQ